MRRISERPAAIGEDAEQAARIASDQRFGELEGVFVDFRHPELPIADWEASASWDVWHRPPHSAGLIFPNEASAGLAALRELKSVGEDLPAIFVGPGDRVTVDHVIAKIEDRRFDHPHDSRQQLAYLKVERATGEIVFPPEPLAFFGRTRIREGAMRDVFDNALERIVARAGLRSLEDYWPDRTVPLWTRPLDEAALLAGQAAHAAFMKLDADISRRSKTSAVNQAALRQLANQATLAGFLLAKSEAKKAEKIGAANMRNLDKARHVRTRHDWRDKARALWLQDPTIRQTRMANLIAEGTDDDVGSITRALRGMEENPRTRELSAAKKTKPTPPDIA